MPFDLSGLGTDVPLEKLTLVCAPASEERGAERLLPGEEEIATVRAASLGECGVEILRVSSSPAISPSLTLLLKMWVSKGAASAPATARLDELSEEGSVGTAGVLRLACVLFVGSEGPGRGVMRESSSSSESGRERLDMSEAVEWETGEDRRGAIEVEESRGAFSCVP